MEKIIATLSVERELKDELLVIEYEIGNGDIHFHSQIEICIVESGSVETLINNSKKTLHRGDIAVSMPYDSHRYISSENSKYSVLILPSEVCENFFASIKKKSFNIPFLCDSGHSVAIMEYLAHIKNESTDYLGRLGYIYLILSLIKGVMLDNDTEMHDDTLLLSKLLLYIDKNYNKSLNLNTISKFFGRHPSYISSYFKSHVNIGISRYINIIRLKNAVVLMQQQKQTVTDIAMECGFASIRTFYRAFRQELGCSPKEYLANLICNVD